MEVVPQSHIHVSGRPATRARWVALGLGVLLVAAVTLFTFSARADVVPTPDTTVHTNGRVVAIVKLGSRIYIGGTFTTVTTLGGTEVSRPYLAAINATTGDLDTGFTPAPNAQVRALASDGTKIFVAGDFTVLGGATRVRLGAVDPATGAANASFRVHPAGGGLTIYAMIASGAHVLVGGSFSQIVDLAGTHARTRFAMVSASTGNVTAWNPAPNATVRAISFSATGSRVFIGGSFTAVGGVAHNFIASIVSSTGLLDPGFTGNASFPVLGLAASNGRVYAAVAGSAGGRCRAMSSVTGAGVWQIVANGNVQAVKVLNGIVYCGGHFSGTNAFGGLVRAKLGAVNASTGAVTDYAPTFNTPLGVFAIGVNGTELDFGGDFTTVSGVGQQGYAQLPTS